jgi:AraC-like DNA-binding protein
LTVRHFRDSTPAEFKSFLANDVEFSADADEIVFRKRVASLPIVGADPYLNRLLRQYADEALVQRPQKRDSVRANVERVIPPLLPHGKAKISEVAGHLGLSCRTLSRSLSAEGLTFTKILDEFRAALARRHLKDRDLPISEIAWLLGYREISAFTNAFKRRTGMNPRQFR